MEIVMRFNAPLAFAAAALLTSVASAQDLFQLSLSPTDGSPTAPVTVGGSKLLSLTEGMLDQSGSFSTFQGVAFQSSLRYAGVNNAMTFNVNAAGDQATLQFTALGGSARVFTFNGANLEDQITDFLGEGAAGELTEFMQEMAKRSVVFVVDGNPSASTARSSRYRYRQFGFGDDLRPRYAPVYRRGEVYEEVPNFGTDHAPPEDQPYTTRSRVRVTDTVDIGTSSLRFQIGGGVIDTDVGDGNEISFTVTDTIRFGDRVSLVMGVPVSFHKIQSAEVYNVQGHVDVPISLVRRTDMDGWTWNVTPGIVLAGSGSIDFVAGGLIWGLGVTNVIGYTYGDWAFSYILQFDFYDSITLKYDNYEWDPGLTQRILTNGGRIAYQFDEEWAIIGGLSHSNFLEDAAVGDYFSPALSLRYRTDHGFHVDFGYEADIADDYESHRANLALQWSF
jgi:hypothetical protein